MATTTSRRKGSNDSSNNTIANVYTGGTNTTSSGTLNKRQNQIRNHANLQMSSTSNVKRSSTGEETLRPLTSNIRNKSSDKLHRSNNSSSNLNHSKRSKSYSQIMSATAETQLSNDKRQKYRRGKSDDYSSKIRQSSSNEEDGWISADQTGSTSDNDEQDQQSPIDYKINKGKARENSINDDKTPRVSNINLPKDDEEQQQQYHHQEEELPRQSSEETLAIEQKDQNQRHFQRQISENSTRTLTGLNPLNRSESQSPTSSKQKRKSLLSNAAPPRTDHTAIAAPKLSTEYAFAGGWGKQARHRSSDSNITGSLVMSPNDNNVERSFDSITSTNPSQIRFSGGSTIRRKSSVSSTRSSFINLPTASPSLGQISHEAVKAETSGTQRQKALDAIQRASSITRASQSAFALPGERSIPTSTSEASRMANKLRMTSTIDSTNSSQDPPSASKMLANSGTKYFMGIKGDGPTAKALARYNKPTISVFVNRNQDFKSVEKEVSIGSLFDENFARANLKNDQQEKPSTSKDTYIRHVMAFGLSGPAIQKTNTTQALLATCLDNDEFESSWAPALTHAAGLGGAEGIGGSNVADELEDNAMNVVGGLYINGPNATPLHFLHGLTNTNDGAFPLDEADLGADSGVAAAGQGEYVDAKNLRAIALTWAALNATKNHIITRRYVDPMRESLERITLAGGFQQRNSAIGSTGNANDTSNYLNANHAGVSSGTTTPGGSLKWGWRALLHHQQQEQQQESHV